MAKQVEEIMDSAQQQHVRRQIGAIAHELSRLAIACDIELGREGLAERVLRNDDSVCRRKNDKAFRKMRQHLMALFQLEDQAIADLGAKETKDILNEVRAALVELRLAGSSRASLPREQ